MALLVLRGTCQHPLVGQVRLERVEDVELLVWPQGHELLYQLARVRAPGRKCEETALMGTQQFLGPDYPSGCPHLWMPY